MINKRMICKLMFCTCCIIYCIYNTSYAYDFFNLHIDEEIYPGVAAVCTMENGSEGIGCLDEYQTIIDILEPKADRIEALLMEADPFWQDRLISYMHDVTTILLEKDSEYTGDINRFFMQYIRLLLDDMVTKLDHMRATITLSSQEIDMLREQADTPRELSQLLRKEIITGLIDAGYEHFVPQPYDEGNNMIMTHPDSWELYTVQDPVYGRDKLDDLVYDLARDRSLEEIVLTPENQAILGNVYLFKNTQDLQNLGYTIVSHRSRTNTDLEYRRENIKRAFTHIGHVKVINPGQTLSYLHDIDFDPEEEQHYLEGKVIALDEEVDEYGGGLCGGSTAIYQGTFLNTALDLSTRNHSKRYSNLYTATINGVEQTIPGIDSTIYAPYLDLKITNTATYPIVLVMNYDGSYGGTEEVFTLSPDRHDRGTYYFTEMEPRTFEIKQDEGKTSKKVTGGCYTRYINGEEQQRCYKEIF